MSRNPGIVRQLCVLYAKTCGIMCVPVRHGYWLWWAWCLCVPGPIVSSGRARHLSDSDWLLLETLDTRCQRPLHTGRFLTMHKRRRKRLTTRSLTQEPALLDDIHHGQVQVETMLKLSTKTTRSWMFSLGQFHPPPILTTFSHKSHMLFFNILLLDRFSF